MGLVEVAYLGCAFVFVWQLVRRADNKVFMAIILFWLFGKPILDRPSVMPNIPGLGVQLSADRMLFLLLSAALLIKLFGGALTKGPEVIAKSRRRGLHFFEWFLLGYIALACVTELLNVSDIGSSGVRQLILSEITFLLIYWWAKWSATPHDYNVLCVALAGMAIASSIVAFIQFTVSPSFLNGATFSRAAFGTYIRSPGLFFTEYDQGMFLILCLAFFRFSNLGSRTYAWVFVLSYVGVLLTFHRLSWIILLTITVLLALTWSRQYFGRIAGAAAAATLVAALALLLLPSLIPQNVLNLFVQERLTQNTLTGRADLNTFALQMIQSYPGGMGDYSSNIYIHLGYFAGLPFHSSTDRLPVGPHNGLLAAGVSYGILGMVAFLGFLGGAMIYYGLRFARGNGTSLPPLLLVVIFLAYNTTNDFAQFGDQAPLFFALVLGFAVARDDGYRYRRKATFEPRQLG